jgi:cytochrome bd ubiquinol oxidase subunit I
VPGVLSFMATGHWNGTVEGVNDIQAAEEKAYGPGDYRPNIPVTYWTFRLMIGFGMLMGLLSLIGLSLLRRKQLPRWFTIAAVGSLALPVLANSMGWIFTEMGRQPWAVFGLMTTADGVSPTVSAGTVLTSLIVFTALYGLLAVVDGLLMYRYAKAGPPDPAPAESDVDEDRPDLVFAY